MDFVLYPLISSNNYRNNDSYDSCLALKPPKNLSRLFNEFNTFSCDINNTLEDIINSKYRH